MAISIDTVYQRVLALASKEQRGYITPQEFNLFANQAQMEIFEQYFYDTNQFKRAPGTDNEYYDMVELLDEKVSTFKSTQQSVSDNSQTPLTHFDFYRLGEIYVSDGSANQHENYHTTVKVEEVKIEDVVDSQISPLTRANSSRPIFYRQGNRIKFIPKVASGGGAYNARYIRKPKKVNWTYVSIDGKALYNKDAIDHQDFELHVSEEPKLVIKILQLAGVTIKDYNLAQLAGQKEMSVKQQEKQ